MKYVFVFTLAVCIFCIMVLLFVINYNDWFKNAYQSFLYKGALSIEN